MKRAVASLSSLSLVFGLLSGCATHQQFNEKTCMERTERSIPVVPLILNFGVVGEEKFSSACERGKMGAAITLNARAANGRLHPISATVGKTFVEAYTDRAKDPAQRDFSNAVLSYYHTFLKSFGNITYDDVVRTLEELAKPPAVPTPIPQDNTPSKPAALPVCTGTGFKRECDSSRVPATPATPASAAASGPAVQIR